ncbi:ABC transporter ATP-binding protein [Parvicella tangerina]|uniref:Ribonucleotide transport ATP-binding protein mkl n=1 Tax=Parvicella tangerina TaxID=2829795 RepID=A0A916JP40_9FLAO|nr:ATP-binding cassette domain-containing protein [Parvicella tangerina]CAG5084214.1 putative ribonucleotide transport ATP-binding protein mkl [Parvicella tangerina]
MIEVKNISKTFGDTQILHDISFCFEKGKTNLIIGQSGSGKSVLTKCIVGLHKPEQGEILFNGRDMVKMNNRDKKSVRKEIGMLFQGSALFDSLTVMENVMYPLTMFTKMNKAEMKERAKFCLDRVDIIGKNDLYPSEISGGMQKRVAIARAIAMKPRYLFCDEPNSGLDPKTSILIDELIKDLTQEYDMTTVVITHDMNSVLEIGDNIMFIYKGHNHWTGNKESILTTQNQEVVDFVYSSKFMKMYREKII